ncbi:Microtubule-associated tumor suppressor candidate 2 [Taenia solium]|eukprot:TsM_000167000 transcript=TsM_000167000 gene=TsM_000167000
MASLIKVSLSDDNRLLSPDSSFLKRPSVIPSIDRLSSSCYGKVQGENDRDAQSSARQAQSEHSKLSTVSLKRSNSSNVPQINEPMSKPQPPFKRQAVLSTGLKSDSNQTFARSSFTKSKTSGSTAGSTRQDKMVAKPTRSTVPGQSKSLVSQSLKTAQVSRSAPSRPKGFKTGTPSIRGSGPTTAASGTKGVSSTPNSQGTKSLKDHLAEIREGSTPRRGLDANLPLRKPSRTATAGASLRRAGASISLIPKTKEDPRSPCEEELSVLRQRFSVSLAEWNKVFEALCVFAQWSLNSRDRLIKETSHREDSLRSQLKLRLQECARFEVQIKELLQQHAESQREKAEMWEKERQIMQIDMENLRVTLRTEKEKAIEKGKLAGVLSKSVTYYNVLLQRDADISELQKAYDNQLSEERRRWAARVAESHQKFSRQFDQQQLDHESQIVELERHGATRIAELENCLKSTELEFSAKVNRLQSECDELRRLSEGAKKDASETSQQVLPFTRPEMSDFSVQIPSLLEDESPISKAGPSQSFSFDDIPVSMTRSCCTPRAKVAYPIFLSPAPTCLNSTQVKPLISKSQTPEATNDPALQEEIESLKTVLEMKSAEAADLRQKIMRLEEELTALKEMNKEIKELQNRNENLEALLELRAESQRQLQDRMQNMFHNLEKEIRDKKKLKTECESLRFKLLDAHHKIDQLNTSNASEDDSFDTTDPLCMSRSLYSDPRADKSMAVVSGRSPQPISETPKSPADADDRLPAGSFISLDTRPVSSSMRLRRGLQHDRSKRRTLATSAELEHHTRH